MKKSKRHPALWLIILGTLILLFIGLIMIIEQNLAQQTRAKRLELKSMILDNSAEEDERADGLAPAEKGQPARITAVSRHAIRTLRVGSTSLSTQLTDRFLLIRRIRTNMSGCPETVLSVRWANSAIWAIRCGRKIWLCSATA